MSRKTPPALCRVVLQFQPKKRNGNESQDTTGFMPCGYFNFSLRTESDGSGVTQVETEVPRGIKPVVSKKPRST